jgi:multiple sugar transport system substrate-binding protein
MRFVTGPEGATIIAKTGTIPAIMNADVISAITATPGFPADTASKDALNVTQAYLEMPMHDKSADIELILNEAHDNIMTENTTVEAGIKEMNDRVSKLLGK